MSMVVFCLISTLLPCPFSWAVRKDIFHDVKHLVRMKSFTHFENIMENLSSILRCFLMLLYSILTFCPIFKNFIVRQSSREILWTLLRNECLLEMHAARWLLGWTGGVVRKKSSALSSPLLPFYFFCEKYIFFLQIFPDTISTTICSVYLSW